MDKNLAVKRTVLFCTITFLLTWSLAAVIPLLGLVYGGKQSTIILAVCMFIPMIGNILTRLNTKQGFQDFKLAPKFKGNGKSYLFSYLVFIILIYLGILLYYLIYRAQFDLKAYVMWNGTSGTESMLAGLILATVISPVINVIPTLGEEIGWRGYLLYQLQYSCGSVKAVLYTGVIWGIWHAPMIAMGHNYGTNYPGYPWVGILMMVIACVTVGVIEGYVTLRTGSVFPAAICHSAINGLISVGILVCNTREYQPIIGPFYFGIIPLIPTIIFAIYILHRMSAPPGENT